MNNFGVIEVASARTTNAPGWAYVPDTGPAPASTVLQPTGNRKRAARTATKATLSHADLDARQEARARRELEILDRDNHRDAVIPIPPKKQPGGGGVPSSSNKHTPNVRRILQSQKTFANHLDDYIALSESASASAPIPTANTARSAAAAASAAIANAKRMAMQQQQKKQEDTPMSDAPPSTHPADSNNQQRAHQSTILAPYDKSLPTPHPQDSDPLLVSRIPPIPTDEELRNLMDAPPLTYLEARAGWTDEDKKYPVRIFCEVCGYWGRVKCMKCGTRVCALECLETHREECITRYGI